MYKNIAGIASRTECFPSRVYYIIITATMVVTSHRHVMYLINRMNPSPAPARSAISVQDLLSPAHVPGAKTRGNGMPSRGPWRLEEDELLIKLVKVYGARNWTQLASCLPKRNGKQTRERWMNQLQPSLKKKNWTANEDRMILKAQRNMGNKWSLIASRLPGRTDNSVKNRYNSTLRRAIREGGGDKQLELEDIIRCLHGEENESGRNIANSMIMWSGGVRNDMKVLPSFSTLCEETEPHHSVDLVGK